MLVSITTKIAKEDESGGKLENFPISRKKFRQLNIHTIVTRF